jgi:hypothetical protein
MDSVRNAFDIDRVVASPTTDGSFTLKLTGTPFPHGLDLVNYSPVRNG